MCDILDVITQTGNTSRGKGRRMQAILVARMVEHT